MKKMYTINISEGIANWKLIFLWLMIIFLITPAVNVEAFQRLTVTGKVRSSVDSSPLPGVNVVLQGGQEGTITDIDGNYTINVPINSNILDHECVNYNSREK